MSAYQNSNSYRNYEIISNDGLFNMDLYNEKQDQAEECNSIFDNLMNCGEPIYDGKGQELILPDEYTTFQIWNALNNCTLNIPPYWFMVKDTHDLITIEFSNSTGNRLRWLHPSPNNIGNGKKPANIKPHWKYCYSYRSSNESDNISHNKNLIEYVLIAICEGAVCTEEARALLNARSTQAIADKSVNVHHIKDYDSYYDIRNDPSNLLICTSEQHKAIHAAGAATVDECLQVCEKMRNK